jgi:hypothetical protein
MKNVLPRIAQLLHPSGVDDIHSFRDCDRTERLVSSEPLRFEVQGDRKFNRVRRSQAARECVPGRASTQAA